MEHLRQKIEYLQKNVSRSILDDIQNQLRKHCDAHSEYYQTWICIQASYAMLKNTRWLRTSLFEDAFSEFISVDLGVDDAVTKFFKSHALPSIRCLTEDSSADDSDFLRYVFIVAASSKSEEDAITNIGLGKALLERLAMASKQLEAQERASEGESTAIFLPDIEEGFVKLLLEIKEESINRPWIVDLYKLGLIIGEDGLPPEKLFDTLLAIGSNPSLSLDELRDRIGEDVEEMLAIAQAKNLIFIDKFHNNPKKQSWRLSDAGFELTSTAFVHKNYERFSDSLEETPALAPSYQAPMLELLFKESPSRSKLVTGDFVAKLSPVAANFVINHLLEATTVERACEIGSSALDSCRSPHSMHSVLAPLSKKGGHPSVRHLFQKVAESATSNLVREVVIEGLVKSQQSE